MIKTFFVLCLLGCLYCCGFDSLFWALDTADAALRASYAHAMAESAARRAKPEPEPQPAPPRRQLDRRERAAGYEYR